MANQAERSDVRKVACAAAFSNRNDVVGIPQRPTVDRLQTPVLQQPSLRRSTTAFQSNICGHGIDTTESTNPFIPRERLLTNEARIRAETPLFHTEIRAEGKPALRHFELTPAAQIATIRSLRQVRAASIPALKMSWF
jgi:hypothetical protein